MPNRILGRAEYQAFRSGDLTRLIAAGETPNLTDKTDFETLPFRIFPPMYAFYFIQADISLPALRPFVYEETVFFPRSANRIRIQDADGFHDVAIQEVVAPVSELVAPNAQDDDYCVFSHTAGDQLLLTAKCAAPLPAAYLRVFGPNTYANCEQYIQEHRGEEM